MGKKKLEQGEGLEWGYHFKWEAASQGRLERGEGVNDVNSWRKSIPTEGTRASAKALR